MKHFRARAGIGWTALAVAATALLPQTGAEAAGPNLVFNPGFELPGGSPTSADGWELFALGGLAERRTDTPNSGAAHILLEGDPVLGANFGVIVQREMPVTPGVDYALSVFAKASAVDGTVGYRPEFYNANDVLIGGQFDLNVSIDSELTDSYQQFSTVFEAPENASTVTIVMFWELLNGLTSVDWDDIYFGAVSADFDADNDVDLGDVLGLQRGFGLTSGAVSADGDADSDGDVDGDDLAVWTQQFDSIPPTVSAAAGVPEPSSLLLIGATVFSLHIVRRRS